MTIAFYSVLLNHHQVHVADELYALLGNNFAFIEIKESCESKGGGDYSQRPYLIKAWRGSIEKEDAMRWAKTADVCVFGGYPAIEFMKERLRNNLLSFDMSERWLKLGIVSLLSPRVLKQLWFYYTKWRTKPLYKLCCSAFASLDQNVLLTYKNKCYKWGYFTKIEHQDIYNVVSDKFHKRQMTNLSLTTIMWCGRFLKWKHPELPIQLVQRLHMLGFPIKLNMYGIGKEQEKIKKLTIHLGVSDIVEFKGYHSNESILRAMRKHDIFLFTSDRYEGWGAVLNEAMSSGCAVVSSDAIGAAPFLIQDGVNGFLFKSKQIDSLYEKVVFLLNHPEERQQMAEHGYQDMLHIWSPRKAAESLLQLINDLQSGRETSLKEGPCSKA